MSSLTIGATPATHPQPARGFQSPSPLREKMNDLVNAARTRPGSPPEVPAGISSTELLERRIEGVETRAEQVATRFDTLTTNMQVRFEQRVTRATEAGDTERAAQLAGKAETLTARLDATAEKIAGYFEDTAARMRQRLDVLYGTGQGDDTSANSETDTALDIQA